MEQDQIVLEQGQIVLEQDQIVLEQDQIVHETGSDSAWNRIKCDTVAPSVVCPL